MKSSRMVLVCVACSWLTSGCQGTSTPALMPTPTPTPAPGQSQPPPPLPQGRSSESPTLRLQLRACSEEASLRAVEGMTLSSIEFQNVSGSERRIYWLNYQGQRVLYNTSATSTSYTQPTYLTHPWIVTDATNTCLAIFLPATVPSSAVLEPGRDAVGAIPEAATRPCSDAPQLRSSDANVTTAIQFVNQTAAGLKVAWIDYQGQRVQYNTLDPGAAYLQPTFVSHPWIVTDAADRCLTVVIPSAQPNRAVIR